MTPSGESYSEPPLIAYLRTCTTDPGEDFAATIQGRSTAGLGIRPKVLDYGSDGVNVYALSGKQVAKVLREYDAQIEMGRDVA